jgi:ribonuclease VapC
MIVDTSVIMAILHDEPERDRLTALMARSQSNSMSAGSRVELSVVVARTMKSVTNDVVESLLARFRVKIVPLSSDQAKRAETGYREFGQGSGHPAKLNFGDCFAYALARETGEPLLFKGDDFAQTDIEPAA